MADKIIVTNESALKNKYQATGATPSQAIAGENSPSHQEQSETVQIRPSGKVRRDLDGRAHHADSVAANESRYCRAPFRLLKGRTRCR